MTKYVKKKFTKIASVKGFGVRKKQSLLIESARARTRIDKEISCEYNLIIKYTNVLNKRLYKLSGKN